MSTNSKYEDNYDQTAIWNLYKVDLYKITLPELLLIHSMYLAKTYLDIQTIIRDQPSPKSFYKSFLELGGTNMASILSFDSNSMTYLL